MIYNILEEIARENSTNQKMVILAKYKSIELLKKVLYLANSKRVKFYIKAIPDYLAADQSYISLEKALDNLMALASRNVTGNEAIILLKNILGSLDYCDADVVEKVIQKDLKIGMGRTNINKVFPALIEMTPYMGAKPYSAELVNKLFELSPVNYSQIKMDGRYCNAIIRNGEVDLESRSGEPTTLVGSDSGYKPAFLRELELLSNCVLNGELTMPNVSRYESNGIIASLVDIGSKYNVRAHKETLKKLFEFEKKHGSYYTALNNITFTVWDILTIDEYFNKKSDVSYKDRLDKLRLVLSNSSDRVEIIKTVLVSSFDEAVDDFKKALSDNQEGTILKSPKGLWSDSKPNTQIKIKLEMDVELVITGFNYGTAGTKNEHVVSSLNAESSDGLIKTRPQGLTEATMQFVTENQSNLINTIITCKCSGLSKDKDGNYSLLHPVFEQLRDDKNKSNSLQEIIDIEAMLKNLS